ncbi:hypothetical protein DERA104750_13045 [Deinococcus radiodurans]
MRGPDHRPDAGVVAVAQAFFIPQPGNFDGNPLAHALPLQVLLVGVGGLDEHENRAAVLPRGLHEGRQRLEAEKRVDGEGVPSMSPAEPALGVGGGGGADVAALAVEQHRQAERAGGGADFFEQGETGQPERLEKGELRLDTGGVRRARFQHVERVLAQLGDVAVLAQTRVEAHAQPGAAGKGALGDGLGEGGGHRLPV